VKSDEAMSAHRATWDAIPWVLNGRATPAQRAEVERHLAQCADCRAEFEFQRQLHDAVAQDGAAVDADPRASLQQLWSRVDAEDAGARRGPTTLVSTGLVRTLAAAVVVEAIGLALLGAALWQPEARYRTLSSADATPAAATVRVVFAPTFSISELDALLASAQLHIVSGPSESGAYALAPVAGAESSDRAHVLAQLRASGGVRFAEPVGAGP
jgi:hypothetical protein